MNELEKMRSGLLADFTSPEIQASFRHCKTLLARFRMMSTYDPEYRSVLEELIPGIPPTSVVVPPFHLYYDWGSYADCSQCSDLYSSSSVGLS